MLSHLALTAWAGPHGESAAKGKSTPKRAMARPSRAGAGENGVEDNDADRVDGTKLFTNDTEPNRVGDCSVSLGYFLSLANRAFDDGGGQVDLGGLRRSELFVVSVTTGLAENGDITVQGTVNRLDDLFGTTGGSSSDFRLTLGPNGMGLTNSSVTLRYRFLYDEEAGRSIAACGGPAFPLQSNSSTFQQFGVNLGIGFEANEWLLPVVELNCAKICPFDGGWADNLGLTLGVVVKPNQTSAFTLGVQKTLAVENFTTYVASGSMQF